jgi:hypothetical protein
MSPTLCNPPRPRRLRRAPLQNFAALKHGFYARKFRQINLVDLAGSQFKGLNQEISLLPVFMRRVIENSTAAGHLTGSVLVLKVFSLAAASLTRIARTQKYLENGSAWSCLAGLQAMLEETYHKNSPSKACMLVRGNCFYLFSFFGTNPRSWGTNPHFLGTNPRFCGTDPHYWGANPRFCGTGPHFCGAIVPAFAEQIPIFGEQTPVFAEQTPVFGGSPCICRGSLFYIQKPQVFEYKKVI